MLDRIFPHSGETMTTAFSFANLVALLVLGLLGILSATTYTTWRRLRHIPGPPSAGLSKWWMLRNTLGGNMHLALKAACDTYGKKWLVTTQNPKFSDSFLVNTKRDMQICSLRVSLRHLPVSSERTAARRQAVDQSRSVADW